MLEENERIMKEIQQVNNKAIICNTQCEKNQDKISSNINFPLDIIVILVL